ncbi:hypothetical protein SAMN05216312_11371 [Cohnella sp. OV330]|nr:hypothetical protein SAMN05216312_11371 [Cohnella sp. OV330]
MARIDPWWRGGREDGGKEMSGCAKGCYAKFEARAYLCRHILHA